jgi:hypothetical protein
LDALTDKKISALARALDPNNAPLKKADLPALHLHLLKLSSQAIEPASKPEKPPKAAKAPKKIAAPKKPKAKRTMSSKAMNAVWDGKNHDDELN